MNVKWGSHIQL